MNVHSFECKVIRTLTELGVEDQLYNYDIVILDTIFNWIAPLDFIFQLQEIIFHKNLIIFTNMGQEKIANHIRLVNKVKGSFAIPFNLDHREAVK